MKKGNRREEKGRKERGRIGKVGKGGEKEKICEMGKRDVKVERKIR
jgi:hypothetical protein